MASPDAPGTAPVAAPATAPATAPAGASRSATPDPGPVARAVDLVKVHGRGEAEVRALDGVSVDFERGRLTAIMGPSGSGKSTLMHCMAALDTPTSGSVVVDGVELSRLGDGKLTKLRRERIGFVFQAYNLVPTLTARENITLPLDIARRKVDQAWFEHVVDVVGLGDRLSHRPNQLSGGQQQRVACARALVSRPAIVFADEPTGNLDSVASAEVLGFLRRSVDDFEQTVVMVTHEPSAAAYADRVLFLADGRLVDELSSPTAEAVLERMGRVSAPAAARARGERP
ncbi:ABC transporter ATP-binding protein [Quadrisphaera sp. DSM 44207]|uniref:ABC transporter ATP-binding protein n=1 Tax=Quadrisphaera sp. DSM 44207 TaxID=1881057 RepID=UPI00088E734C|nr:ABC transporter ATP-binding protein [Quadrisphaera sp. DSM 44207]SDQ78123.1 putative ABC transport system ATP-binding protein [Quadrisphaera sp. DSM 44207]